LLLKALQAFCSQRSAILVVRAVPPISAVKWTTILSLFSEVLTWRKISWFHVNLLHTYSIMTYVGRRRTFERRGRAPSASKPLWLSRTFDIRQPFTSTYPPRKISSLSSDGGQSPSRCLLDWCQRSSLYKPYPICHNLSSGQSYSAAHGMYFCRCVVVSRSASRCVT